MTNSKAVMNSIDPKDSSFQLRDLNLLQANLPVERALGVHWCVQSDTFQFRITLQDKPLSRRSILATVASVFDPLGLLAPVILRGKQILQQLVSDRVDWDSPLPDSLRVQWELWRNSLHELETLKIERCYKPLCFGDVVTAELHNFSDASNIGYGECSYLRLMNSKGEIHCTLVMAKSRVVPLRPVTVPRLELTAAVLAVKISSILVKELEYDNISEHFWTDSQIVLGYIQNDAKRFKVFVANRVQQIREHSNPSQWSHVRTAENPADLASRGIDSTDFLVRTDWFTGPRFLQSKQVTMQDSDSSGFDVLESDPEVRRVKSLATQNNQFPPYFESERLEGFSDWFRAKRAIANCMKLVSRVKNRTINSTVDSIITVQDLKTAELEIIKSVQRDAFESDIVDLAKRGLKRSSPLFRLDPFLDSDGVLRVGGRIKRAKVSREFKHPAILPRKHHVSQLLIKHFHEQVQHQGRGFTTNEIRSNGYWIIGCSSAISHFIRKCVTCRKLRSTTCVQKMADLPEDRLEPTPPFTYCGVDYFGPWYVKSGRKIVKRWACVFVCMSLKAIHIELCQDLTTDHFINAFRRFSALRGPVRQLRSDRGTSFVGAMNELKNVVNNLNTDEIKHYLLKKGCDFVDFKMNVPHASHTGGLWERQIRTIRGVLSSMLNQSGSQLDEESLRTLLYEVSSVVNSRPLSVDNINDPMSLEPLTPNHLLTLKSKVLMSPPGVFEPADLYSTRMWRRVQHLTNVFWTRWKNEYLSSFQKRQKWVKPVINIKIGDIVLIKDDNLPRNEWRLARVSEVCPSQDGLVRSAKLTIGDPDLDSKGKRINGVKVIERPIQKLIILLQNSN